MGDILLSTDVTSVVMFVVFGIILGVVLELLLSNFQLPIPYTVLVFYVGVIFGAVIGETDVNMAEFLTLSSVSADVIVYGFLPTLLFSETMGLNIHHLTQCFGQAALLAGPGAIIVCMLLAVCAYGILPWGWGWMYCFLFGAILSATDPVSVVSLMKSTNCSTKLTMVIAGESLLNDGSAMILFLFFYNMINGYQYDAESFIGFCAEMLILSPLIGLVLGLICSRLMRRINTPTNSHLDFQLILTFICAYSSYIIAAKLLDVSGVLSCCVAGFTVSIFAPVIVLQDEKFHQIWSYAEWACNTLIFLLAGVIGGGKSSGTITMEKVGYLVIFYFLLTITRAIAAFVSWPLLNRMGEPFSFAEMEFMTFAGLRGALGIALALVSADNAHDNNNDDIGDDLFFMITGLASFTLLFNGSTAGWVLLKLKLVDDPDAPISPQLQQVLSRIRAFISSLLQEEVSKMQEELGDYDNEELQHLCELLYVEPAPSRMSGFAGLRKSLSLGRFLSTDKPRTLSAEVTGGGSSVSPVLAELSKVRKKRKSRNSDHKHHNNTRNDLDYNNEDYDHDYEDDNDEDLERGIDKIIKASTATGGRRSQEDYNETNNPGMLSMRVSGSTAIDRDLLHYTRVTYLDVVRARYAEAVHKGKMSSSSAPARILYYSVDVAMDHVWDGLCDWEVILTLLKPPQWLLRVCQSIDDANFKCGRISGLVSAVEVSYEKTAIYVITNFIYAHQFAQNKIHYFLGGPINKDFDIAEPEQNQVKQESMRSVDKAKELLKSINPSDVRKVGTHRAAKIVLLKQAEIIHTIVHDGILSEKNAANLLDSLQRERDRIHVLRANHERDMVKENLKEKLQFEKEIRESMRTAQRPSDLSGHSGGAAAVPGSLAAAAAVTSNVPRSNLIINLTGEDNIDRLSSISRGSFAATNPSPAIPIPGAHPAVTHNPMTTTTAAYSHQSRSINSLVQSPPRSFTPPPATTTATPPTPPSPPTTTSSDEKKEI